MQGGHATLPPTILMLGIRMAGTTPIFYHIPVSTKLLDAVDIASFPEDKTVVFRFIPPVPDLNQYFSDGMRPLVNRRIILQCFDAFKGSLVCLLHALANYCISFIHAEQDLFPIMRLNGCHWLVLISKIKGLLNLLNLFISDEVDEVAIFLKILIVLLVDISIQV